MQFLRVVLWTKVVLWTSPAICQHLRYPSLHCEYIGILCVFNNSLLASHIIFDRSSDNNWSICINHVYLTHWGRVTHICIGNLTIIGSDNGLSLGRRQAITWTNVWILVIGPLGTNFSEVLIEIFTFSFKKIHLKMSSRKMSAIFSRPQCVKV